MESPVVFRFPSPRDERIILAVLMIVGILWIPMMLWFAARRTGAVDVSLADVIRDSRALRTQLAALVTTVTVGTYAGVCFLWIKARTTLEVGSEWLVFRRPGVPLFGLFGQEIRLSPEKVDQIVVERTTRATVSRVETRIESGRDEIRVNLGHAVREGQSRPAKKLLRKDWESHPLVAQLTQVCNKQPEIR